MSDPVMTAFLKDCIGIVEATSFEQLCLWRDEHEGRKIPWDQTGLGYLETVGSIGNRPVCISLSTVHIDGKKILFIDATSQVVDHDMIEKWLEQNMPDTAFRDNYNNIPGRHLNKVNSMNYHNVFR